MPLLLSLGRETLKRELGARPAVVLKYDELCQADGETLLARHRINRWIAEPDQEFATLEIVGPLIVTPIAGETPSLGPYLRLSMFDGVAYVDGACLPLRTFSSGTGTCTTSACIGRRCELRSTKRGLDQRKAR
jgi:hypothetical protein